MKIPYNKKLDLILSDLQNLFKINEILVKEFQTYLNEFKSKEVKTYLTGLSKGSKPEQVLRETFFTFNAKLAQYLFKNIFPEVSQKSGFIDYLIKEEREEISLEIKPLYVAFTKKEKTGTKFLRIKKKILDPQEHEKQIKKYLQDKRDYVVLTNLEEWYFYSKTALLNPDFKYFGHLNLFDLLENFKQVGDFWKFLDNQEDLSVKEPLDYKFFNSLKNWVLELSKIKFTVDDNKKTNLIINLVNKFIFIHSLDSFWVISKNYIGKEWSNIERKWTAKNKLRILRKYLEDINEYFYELYDTELFKITEENQTILDFIEHDPQNIELTYKQLKIVLGIDYNISPLDLIPGVIQYNFRRIDEDILGKSYETFLAEIRKEQGIFYTPKYITHYIVNNTMDAFFRINIEEFKINLENKEFSNCKALLNKIFLFRVIDPACGSGSFLIKALKIIWKNYTRLNEIIGLFYDQYSNFKDKIIRSDQIENDFKEILSLKNTLNFENKRELISKIIVRHIHGVDLDYNAIEVAKLNLWLEAIKLAPQEFQFDKVPADTNHILPDLEMNLCNGDSLVGLPSDNIISYLIKNHYDDLKLLFKLRLEYITDPAKIDLVKEIVGLKSEIKIKLDRHFNEYLKNIEVDEVLLDHTKPFYWELDFWYIFFDKSINKLPQDLIGFDSVIGNPPYFTIRGKGTGSLVKTYSYAYLQKSDDWKENFRSQSDIYYYFIIKSIRILKKTGTFGFIIESYWLENDYADRLKECMLKDTSIQILINFGKVKKIFEDADNNTCILIFEKNQKELNSLKYIYCKKNFSIGTQQQNNQELVKHITQNISKQTFSDEYIDIYLVAQESLGTSKWVLSKSIDIIKKIEDGKTLLGELYEIGQGMVPGRKKEFRISSHQEMGKGGGYWTSKNVKYIEVVDMKDKNSHRLEAEFIKPLITNSGIKKFFIIPSRDYLIYTVPLQDGRENINDFPGILNYLKVYEDELKKRYDYDELEEKYPWYGYQRIQNIELFERSTPKILCPYRSEENNFALDDVGYFGTTDMYAIVPKNNTSSDLYYLLGILNSKLLTFWYKEAGKSKGLILEFFATPLSKMPIIIEKTKQQEISKLSLKISALTKISYKFKQTWLEISQKYRNGIISLGKLLVNDKAKIQDGEFEKVWISDINIFPNEKNNKKESFSEFKKFRVIIHNNLNLKIYGIKDRQEILLLDLETTKQEFRDIIYLEVQNLLQSRRKIKSLKTLLSKTEVSIIKPNIWKKSLNLLRYTKTKFQKETKSQLTNLIQLDNIIQDLEIELDVLVFRLYDLSKDEIEIVLDSLMTINRIKIEILNNFISNKSTEMVRKESKRI